MTVKIGRAKGRGYVPIMGRIGGGIGFKKRRHTRPKGQRGIKKEL